MKKIILLTLLVMPVCGFGQSVEINYSSNSVQIWGKMPATSRIGIGYNQHIYSQGSLTLSAGMRFNVLKSKSKSLVDDWGAHINGNFVGFFVTPAVIDYKLSGRISYVGRYGGGVFNDSFPNIHGKHFNFLIENGLAYRLTGQVALSVRYSHISNCWRGVINPGVDNFISTLMIKF